MTWKDILGKKDAREIIEDKIRILTTTLSMDYGLTYDDIQNDVYPDGMDEEDIYGANFVAGGMHHLKELLKNDI